MRRTKIVATLGPATEKPAMIRALIEAGVDVFRLNRSHGSQGWHEKILTEIRNQSKTAGKPVAVMVDLQGPKLRIGLVADDRRTLAKGSAVTLRYSADGISDETTLYVPLREIVRDVKAGDRILLDDGNIILSVVSKRAGAARCRVIAGGVISSNKGINLPGVDLSIPSVTDKDVKDLEWAARAGVEYVAVSFVRRAEDIVAVRSRLHAAASDVQVVAKVEKPEALKGLEEIARLADGLMVARGDLGVEMPLEDVPVAQGRIIAVAHDNDIPVIVATQMLDSMTSKPRPTRAEVSDVAAAIFGGTDAVMLSGETAVGAYPVESVRQMSAIAEAAESHLEATGAFSPVLSTSAVYAVADAVCHGAYSAARDLGAKAVFISTTSGRTALLFSKYRFTGALIGGSDDEKAVRRMSLYWGVRPVRVPRCRDHHRLLGEMVDVSLEKGFVSAGDTVIFMAGSPLGKTGATNLLMVRRVEPKRRPSGRDKIAASVKRGRLEIDRRLCILCGACVGVCPVSVFAVRKGKIEFERGNLKRCLGDWRCRDICPVGAIKATASRRRGKAK